MLSNGNKQTCGFSDEIVSYIYDEIGRFDRKKFESHLADCAACTDEFRAISNARISVFEWKREEFTHLSTPEIVIPYPPTESTKAEERSVGFLAGLRGMFSGWPVAVAATGLVCLGMGFLAMTYIGRGDQQIAEINPQSVPPVIAKDDPVKIESSDIDIRESQNMPSVGVTTIVNNKTRPAKAAEYKRPKPGRQMTADTQQSVNNVKAPVLISYDEADDRSLRLTDLFDDGGSKR